MLEPTNLASLRRRYDDEVRARPQTDDPAYVHGWHGPVYRVVGPAPRRRTTPCCSDVDVYGDPAHARWLADALTKEKRSAPASLVGYAALAGDEVVSAGWARFPAGAAFGSLWGGATRAAWRGRGVYIAYVARRAADARARGVRWLAVDCSPESLPILLRRGFVRVATTTPWVRTP